MTTTVAEYPNLEPPTPNPLAEVLGVLKECILALRWAQPNIAQQPKRLVLEVIADRAEQILGRHTETTQTPGGAHDAVA